MKKFITLWLVSMLHLILPNSIYSQQPPYQVSIFLNMPGNYAKPMPVCNGVTISEKLILTTAGCVHIKFGINGKSNMLDASVISVFAGSSNGQTETLQMNVSSIDIPTNYDPVTCENDLALLTLSESMPLGTRRDIRWIMIDDNSHQNRSCLVNFYSRNPDDAISDYYQTEELYMVNNEICRNLTKYPAARKRDICSFYVLPHQYDCAKADSFLSFNNDRGTGLVCKNFLVGLLSSVVTRPNPAKNCTDILLRAIYTDINPHLRWIYSIMSKLDTEYISTPYNAGLNLNPLVSNPMSTSANITSNLNSTLAVNSTTLSNSTISSFPFTNLTMPNHFSTNSSILNSTLTNSTLTNSTFVNSTVLHYATPNPLSINSTKSNTTSIGKPSRNHTIKPITFGYGPPVLAGPGYGSSTDLHSKHPNSNSSNSKPAVQNVFKNSGFLVRASSGSLLISLISLRLIVVYL